MINTLTASHAASMIDTTDYIMCGNGGYFNMYNIQLTTRVYHMIFRGDNAYKIHSIELYGVSMCYDVCLYTPSIKHAV